MAGNVQYQILGSAGHWQTLSNGPYETDQIVQITLLQLKKRNQNIRVRAIDENGRLLDMM